MMWKQFVYNEINYLLKMKEASLFITDLKSVWSEELDEENLAQRFQELNPLFVGCDVHDELMELFNNIPEATVSLLNENTNVMFEINSAANEFPVRFRWRLTKRSSDIFFQEVTLTLIHTIQVLESQQQNLCGLLERKDTEIKEYKRENGGEIARDYLKTPKFNKAFLNFPSAEQFLLGAFTNKVFLETFTKKYGDVTSNIQSDEMKMNIVKKRKLKPYVSKTQIN